MVTQDEKRARSQVVDQAGVVVGLLLGFSDDNVPLVAFPGSNSSTVQARTTVSLSGADVGSQVALLFSDGCIDQPLVIGKILSLNSSSKNTPSADVQAQVDDNVVTLKADQKIVLKCGKASITLTKDGKILLQGTYVSSRSSGVQRVKGASVKIN